MSKKPGRLNDTAALQAIPAYGLDRSESRSTSTRRIENGFVTSESSFKDGKYESSERYTETPPNLGVDDGANAMAKAVAYMKREGTL